MILNFGSSADDGTGDLLREAFRKINVMHAVISRTTTAPPASPAPATGDIYIVPASATGDFASQDGKIAYYGPDPTASPQDTVGWQFFTPTEGMRFWVNDDDELVYYNGSAWAVFSGGGGSSTFTMVVAASDETTDLTTGTAKVTFRMPAAVTLTDVRANVNTAPTGSAITVDINESGVSILSTKLTIDATEKTSETAATPAVISDSSLADDAEMTIDIDAVGSTIAGTGLKVALIGTYT